jgi:hypothetical protein
MKKPEIAQLLVCLVIFYFIISTLIYRFKHPEMTETQLFLNVPRALIFNK